jgi:cysteine desulfurase
VNASAAPGAASPVATYLDHAATTPMLPEAVAVMAEALARTGNASSLHSAGRQSRRLVEESRERIAEATGARPSEVVLTTGGTEGDNLAVKGLYWARRAADPGRTRVLVSEIEHHAVLESAEWLAEHEGAQVELLPVDREGRVRPEALRAALAREPERVALVSVMWANNEVGTVQPIAEVARLGAEYGVPVHSDAIAAAGHLPIDFAESGLSALSIAGHKFGGPQGTGALLLQRDVACTPLLHGGGHERDIRSGTQDVPAAAGMAAALRAAVTHRDAHNAHVVALRDRLRDVLVAVGGVQVNGALGHPDAADALPGIVHVSFDGCEGDSLLMLLDAKGVECSTGSACTAGVAAASHVLLAMGLDMGTARGSLRFSLAHDNNNDDVTAVADVIGDVVDRARAAGLLSAGSRTGGRR